MTKSKEGSNLIYKNQDHYCPTFINKTIDTTGCGDAYFMITSLLIIIDAEKKLIPFIGNSYAGLHSQFFGNENTVDMPQLSKYLKTILNF
jgi:bifunctional ADP-heptose synthase (sugar kinase/adenylyltransferase)